jgi:long-chain acyl-CoA synthetase
MNLVSAFSASVSRLPAKTAVFYGEVELSYTDIWQQANWLCFQLTRQFHVKPGDRVALWLKNCPEFIPSLLGILKAGAVAVPINNFLKSEEVGYILNDAEVDVVITDTELGTHHRAINAIRSSVVFLKIEEAFAADWRNVPDLPAPSATAEDLAVLIYTSGTTGKPKGAMLSHGNLLHNVESCRIVLQTVQADRIAVLLPMFHSYMLTVGLLLPLLVGGSVVVIKSLHPVKSVIEELLRKKVTVLPAIPQFYRSLAHAPVDIQLPLRIFISGAAPLPVQVLHDFEKRYGIPLIEGYGLSEASPVVTKNPLDGTRKPGSIGIPITNVEVTVQDDQGRVLPPGEIGEICVRGGNVMLGYWKKSEETAKVMREDWLLTGDIGYRDTDGYFYITDRKKDMLLVNGINVYPREIEEVIYTFPGIKEAAVVGKPDPRKGEQPIAFVSLNEGQELDTKELQLFLKRKLADYKLPKTIIVLPTLPRNATGKILKTALRDKLQEAPH